MSEIMTKYDELMERIQRVKEQNNRELDNFPALESELELLNVLSDSIDKLSVEPLRLLAQYHWMHKKDCNCLEDDCIHIRTEVFLNGKDNQ